MKEGDAAMLLRFDPFRDIDRLANEILGAPRVPQPMPMDCYRHGDTFFLHFDLPGIDIDTLEVTEENNTLTVRAAGAGQKTISGQTTEGDQSAGATTS
jgi:HSP20 family molecular chaperone IbpA